MSVSKEEILPIFAMIVLIIGVGASLYVHAEQSRINQNLDSLIINGISFDIDDLFSSGPMKTINVDADQKTGIPTDKLIQITDIICPSCHTYTFIASDGYQQTINWEHMEKGVFTKEKRVFFPGLAHAFWVRDVIEIKVD